jgi:hypothetical protein
MWCDDFDMDLYRAIPEAREVLAPHGGIVLYVHAGETGGKLNHPSAWNHDLGLVCFFGFSADNTGKPESYWTGHPIVRCTLEEAIRDLWVHNLVMLVDGFVVWNAEAHAGDFQTLMYHLRGWRLAPQEHLDAARKRVLATMKRAVERVAQLKTDYGRGGESSTEDGR